MASDAEGRDLGAACAVARGAREGVRVSSYSCERGGRTQTAQLRADVDFVYLKVKVHPDAGENRLEQKGPDQFEIWVRAEPEHGQANQAVLALLANRLGTDLKNLRIVKGATSPSKIIMLLDKRT